MFLLVTKKFVTVLGLCYITYIKFGVKDKNVVSNVGRVKMLYQILIQIFFFMYPFILTS